MDNLGDYTFFFASEGNKKYGCYLAPERFVSAPPDESASSRDPDASALEAKRAMDVFSLGCVIAEIFMGHPLFDRPKLQAYKKGDLDIKQLLREIDDEQVRLCILDMIQLDPTKRKQVSQSLDDWCAKVFPGSFTIFLYYFMATLLHPSLISADKKVAYVYKYIDAIWSVCFHKSEPQLVTSVNNVLFEKLRDDPLSSRCIKPENFQFCIDGEDTYREVNWSIINQFDSAEARYASSQQLAAIREKNRKSIIIIVHLLGMLLAHCQYPSSKICALSILRQIGLEVLLAFIVFT